MRRTSKVLSVAMTCVLVATSVTVLGSASPAAAAGCQGNVPSDFNGDGVADAAIVDEHGTGVRIIYGTRSGLTLTARGTAPANQIFTDDGQLYGDPVATVTGDFNGDGCSDLAVGYVWSNDDNSTGGHGVVRIYSGSPSGLKSAYYLISPDQVTGVTPGDEDAFGTSLAVADFNKDGYADLVVGSPGYNNSAGAVYIYPGSPTHASGTNATGRQYVEGDGTIPGAPESNDKFGQSIAAADFDTDGIPDLAIGVPGEDGYGEVMVINGTGDSTLLTKNDRQIWSQASPGILGSATAGDEFGEALVAADFDGNYRTDLAIGVPNEGVNGVAKAGAVNVLYSAGTLGLVSTNNQLWTQNSSGLGSTALAKALFGGALVAGDFNDDGFTDLAVGIPGEPLDGHAGAGAIEVLPGSVNRLTTGGAQFWSQDSAGVYGAPNDKDNFGEDMAAISVTQAHRDDLLIGVPGEMFTGEDEWVSGMVQFLPGGAHGLTSTGEQDFSPYTIGLATGLNYIGVFGAGVS